MPAPPPQSDRLYNNADSFAQAFDSCWTHLLRSEEGRHLDRESRLEAVLARVADHPFAAAEPAMARQVAAFRMRLLGL